MLLFRSEEHVQNWCGLWGRTPGAMLSLKQAWELAKAWYGPDRREAEWRRKPVDEVEALFVELGLTGAFWQLR